MPQPSALAKLILYSKPCKTQKTAGLKLPEVFYLLTSLKLE